MLAPELAKLLEADPVATGQVKEHIKAERLMELLNLTHADLPERGRTLAEIVADEGIDPDDVLDYVVNKFHLAEILAALNGD
jgi:hypothetical protein